MAILSTRQNPSHFASHAQQTLSSWDSCMAKAYCKWPAIIGIIIASVIIISILGCCLRCLCCGLSFCPCGQRRSKRSTYPSGPSAFSPGLYQGYQPANSSHGYAPPQYAHFDSSKSNRVHEDSLPAMPSWGAASQKRVLEEENYHGDVEMGKMEQKAPMLAHQAPSPTTGYVGIESGMPYQQHGARQGGDLGNPYGHNASSGHTMSASPGNYDLPDDFGGQSTQGGYTPYAHSSSLRTKYEPSPNYGAQETGTAYHSQSYNAQPPSIVGVGRQTGPMF